MLLAICCWSWANVLLLSPVKKCVAVASSILEPVREWEWSKSEQEAERRNRVPWIPNSRRKGGANRQAVTENDLGHYLLLGISRLLLWDGSAGDNLGSLGRRIQDHGRCSPIYLAYQWDKTHFSLSEKWGNVSTSVVLLSLEIFWIVGCCVRGVICWHKHWLSPCKREVFFVFFLNGGEVPSDENIFIFVLLCVFKKNYILKENNSRKKTNIAFFFSNY